MSNARNLANLLGAGTTIATASIADDAKTAAANAKTALRNAPAASAITNAANITALKNTWNTSLLGDSPYA